MKKLLLLLLCLFCLSQISADAIVLIRRAGGGAPAGPEFSDDFSGGAEDPPTGWNELHNTFWNQTAGGLLDSNSADGAIVYGTDTGSVTQYSFVQIATNANGGVALRSTGTGSDGYYAVYFYSGDNTLYWERWTNAGYADDIGSTSATIDAGDFVGVTIQGTGNQTVVKVWDLGASACQSYPTDKDNWCSASDAAEYTFPDNPPTAEDTGQRVGCANYGGAQYGEWAGGSID